MIINLGRRSQLHWLRKLSN